MKDGGLYRNSTSYFGMLVMLTSAGLILLSAIVDLGFGRPNPYLGIITYLVFPAILIAGLLLVLYGMRRESLRRRRSGSTEAPAYPRLDLNDRSQRRRFAYFLVGSALLVTLLTFAAYNAFLFTDSVTFCGRICHTVMKPEYTAYLYSPHARVPCVDCHVGEGASWYVRSKLSGVRQVFAVLTGTYERPIPTPIANLRPARETCEECHWPEKFFGAQLVQNPHFRYDEKNTAEQVSFLVKTGGGARTVGESAGIHWHMVIGNKVYFYATDEKKQVVPLVRVERGDGTTATYHSLDLPALDERAVASAMQRMDCMNCHNRPTHIFPPADVAVDHALAGKLMPSTLPWIKQQSVSALVAEYAKPSMDGAGIRAALRTFYDQKYPQVASSQMADITKAIEVTTGIYGRTVFPEMNVTPATYPTDIGHRDWPGCFRCHDGRHVSGDGKVLTRSCDGPCHTMPERGPLELLGVASSPKLGWHPWELKGKHAQVLCSRCHSPDLPSHATCAGCHRIDTAAPMMSSMECQDCHVQEQQRTPVADCKQCHAERQGLHNFEAHGEASCTDCHKPHAWLVTGRDTCLACHSDKRNHYLKGACADCHSF